MRGADKVNSTALTFLKENKIWYKVDKKVYPGETVYHLFIEALCKGCGNGKDWYILRLFFLVSHY